MHGYGAYKHSDTLRFRSILFKDCHASSLTPCTIYYQNPDCGGVALTVLLQDEASRADIRKYRCLALNWPHKKAYLKLQLKHLVVITLF